MYSYIKSLSNICYKSSIRNGQVFFRFFHSWVNTLCRFRHCKIFKTLCQRYRCIQGSGGWLQVHPGLRGVVEKTEIDMKKHRQKQDGHCFYANYFFQLSIIIILKIIF